jgi:hypothetical protein
VVVRRRRRAVGKWSLQLQRVLAVTKIKNEELLGGKHTLKMEYTVTFADIPIRLRMNVPAWGGEVEISAPHAVGRPVARFKLGRGPQTGKLQIAWLSRPHVVLQSAADVIVPKLFAHVPLSVLTQLPDLRGVDAP